MLTILLCGRKKERKILEIVFFFEIWLDCSLKKEQSFFLAIF